MRALELQFARASSVAFEINANVQAKTGGLYRRAHDRGSGAPGYTTANWWGVAVPRGASPQLVARLNKEINAVLVMPNVEKRLINEGAEPAAKTPDELGKHVASEMAKWVRIAKIAGIRGE